MGILTHGYIGVTCDLKSSRNGSIVADAPTNCLRSQPWLAKFEFKLGEETVTYEEKLRSLSHDVVKVNAYMGSALRPRA